MFKSHPLIFPFFLVQEFYQRSLLLDLEQIEERGVCVCKKGAIA